MLAAIRRILSRSIPRSHRLLRDSRGMSLVETSVVLGTAAILASSLATVGFETVETARHVVARGDVERIAAALGQLLTDRGSLELTAADGNVPELLASVGEPPRAPGDTLLAHPVDGMRVVDLSAVLWDNSFGLAESTDLWQPGWRGPYLHVRTGADPWGHRYGVRLIGPAVYVLSAGPDGEVQSGPGEIAPRIGGDDIVYLLSTSAGR